MRNTFTIVIVMITLNLLAQNQPSKWSFNFNYQNDSYIPKSGTEPPKAFGTSSFRGWTAGMDRTLYQKKYLKLNAGLSLNKKTQIMAGSRFVDPFTRAPEKGLDYYYLSVPVTLQYVKSKVIQPSITITPSVQIFSGGEFNNIARLYRPPTGNFLQIMPGADIRLSDRLKIFVGASLNRYDFFGNNAGRWSSGFQIGIKITLNKKKSTAIFQGS